MYVMYGYIHLKGTRPMCCLRGAAATPHHLDALHFDTTLPPSVGEARRHGSNVCESVRINEVVKLGLSS